VPQLFSGTIADNIRYGRLDASMDEIAAAVRAANALDFIERLPQGFETELAEGGAQLSVGERQRICVARAFLKDAPILILDEPTSSIDSRTEGVILDALDELMVGRTTFMIAHRLSTIRHADVILVLNHGELVESGSHEELLESNGLYRELYDAQIGAHRLGSRRRAQAADAPAEAEKAAVLSLAEAREARIDAGGGGGVQIETGGHELAALAFPLPEPVPAAASALPEPIPVAALPSVEGAGSVATAAPPTIPFTEVELSAVQAARGMICEVRYDSYVPCPTCAQTGHSVACPECQGLGRFQVTHVVPVRIPAGARDGQRFSLGTYDGAFTLLHVGKEEHDSSLVRLVAFAGCLVSIGFMIYLLFFS
jgi:ABC transporter